MAEALPYLRDPRLGAVERADFAINRSDLRAHHFKSKKQL
jgi:hypothetical protein